MKISPNPASRGLVLGLLFVSPFWIGLALVCGLWGCSGIQSIPSIPSLPEPGADDPAAQPATGDAIVLSSARVYEANGAEVATWPVTVTIQSTTVDNMFRWTTEPAKRPWKDVAGCDGCLWLFQKRADGLWHGGPGDFIRTGQGYKSRRDLKFFDGEERRPASGETVAVMLSTRCRHSVYPNGRERSNIVLVRWP